MAATESARIHATLGHPVIDTDAHWMESMVVMTDYVRELAGNQIADRFASLPYIKMLDVVAAGGGTGVSAAGASGAEIDQRRDAWTNKGIFWGLPVSNTLDRATAMLPGLMAQRLDEMGIDISLVYGSFGIHMLSLADAEIQTVGCRAYNQYAMDQFRPYLDRLLPVASIPMATPAQAIDELEYAVKTLGYRAVVLQQWVSRPIPKVARELPDAIPFGMRPDLFGLDSEYDYDPVWAKCVELGVAATFHSMGAGPALAVRGSVSNSLFNRVGMFAFSHHKLASALFFGGVTRRFPTLNIAFMEGGVAWAAQLYSDLVGLWKKRNIVALETLNPANLDRELLFELLERHAEGATRARLDDIRGFFGLEVDQPADRDEFKLLAVDRAEQLGDLFASRFYFGCEGDDAMNALAFKTDVLPFERPLKAVYGSDIGHWDVSNMAECLQEAYEPVEEDLISAEQFREFAFVNPVRLHGEMNPDFFAGTRVEGEARKLLAGEYR